MHSGVDYDTIITSRGSVLKILLRDLKDKGMAPIVTTCGKKHIIKVDGEFLDWRLGPSKVGANEITYTDKHGRPHRGDDQPAKIYDGGYYEWFKHGQYHRDGDQPAVFSGGDDQMYYKDGLLHRDNHFPAVDHINQWPEWWQRGEQYWPFELELEEETACA